MERRNQHCHDIPRLEMSSQSPEVRLAAARVLTDWSQVAIPAPNYGPSRRRAEGQTPERSYVGMCQALTVAARPSLISDPPSPGHLRKANPLCVPQKDL